jgi:hypothetical protein
MNHDRDKASILDVLVMLLMAVYFTGMTTLMLLSGGLIPGLALGALALLATWSLIKNLRYGVRLPTRWEWFKAWMSVRPALIGAAGLAFFMALVTYGPPKLTEEMKIALTGSILVWGIMLAITIWRAPRPRRRGHEDDASYKKRIGWKGPDE